MPTITLREVRSTEQGFEAELIFDGRSRYPIMVADPFALTPAQEELLEWYFEEWIRFPFTDRMLKQQAEDKIADYGRALFEQVFRSDPDAYSEYRQLRSALSQVQIEIEGQSPEFQALHWEAMRDPDWPRPLAVDAIMVRKLLKPQPIRAQVTPAPVINLLVVIARPDEEKDVGYRTISRPLIEAIQQSQLRVNIEILRPGTFEALARHLQQAEKQNFYHIIHFDLHGALATYEQIQQGVQKDRYVYLMQYAQRPLQQYDGVKAYLFFEGEAAGQATPVEAADIANLLTGAGIPVCILNACQSGKQVRQEAGGRRQESESKIQNPKSKIQEAGAGSQEGVAPSLAVDARETSLGSRLMSAGMQMVVAMGYSVTVSAAKLMMQRVYGELFNQRGMAEALRLGRMELFQNKQRKIYYDRMESLEDWLLPVVYCNQTVDLKLREFTPQEKEQDLLQRRQQFRFDGSKYGAEYGFVGRDLDILKLEKALLRHNLVLLQGMGGTGKTTLLNYLREWWQVTHYAAQIFYFGYDEKAWSVEQIVQQIGKALFDRFNSFHGSLSEAKEQQVIDTLRAMPYVLMLDNLESVTGQALAIQNTLSKPKQEKLRQFLQRLVGGKTRVILGSRSSEPWLQSIYGVNRYELRGLDREAQTDLATKVLERQVQDPKRIQALLESEDLKRLLKLLAGYPLAIEVVLANLRQQSPSEILAALQAADVTLDRESEDKTQSIVKCVEYSHSRLSPNAQKLLLCLAPFSGFIDRRDLPNYAKQLQQFAPFQNYDFDQFEAAIQEAINWGLLAPHESGIPELLTIQPVFPYFLKTRLSWEDATLQEALRDGFKNHYRGLASSYQQWMQSKELQERQMGIVFCRWEYENLYHALQICLEKQESISIYRCLDTFLDLLNDVQNRLKLSEAIYQAQKSYPAELLKTNIGWEISEAFLKLGNGYLETQNYPAAQTLYQEAIKLLQRNTSVSEQDKQLATAMNYGNLGTVAQRLRQYEQAYAYYQQALDLKIEFNDRYSQASTYHNLGIVAQEQRQYQQAQDYFQQALNLCIEFNDRYNQASTYHQLGMVAQEQRQYQQAQDYLQQALNLFIEFNDRYEQAKTYHNLGIVAQEQRQYQQAQDYLQQALDLFIEFNDRYSQASTYHNLGRVAQEQRQYQQAQDYFQQALDLFIEFNDRYSQASTYHQLGIVAQEQRQYQQAQDYFQQALNLKIEFNDRYSQAGTYHQLGMVAQEQRQYQQAQDYFQQALDLFIEFNDRYNQASTYHQLGMVAQQQRQYQQAQDYLQQALNLFIEFNDRYNQASTYGQLGIVAQGQRQYQQAQDYCQQALNLFIEFNDRYFQARTYHNLGIVAQEQRQYQQAQDYFQQALDLFIEFNDRYSQASTYHNLGRVAQEQRQYQQAQDYFQQALDLFIEFNDRYSQASTYSQLGLLAEELDNLSEAVAYHLQDLQISIEFQDERRIKFVLGNLARIYQVAQDESLLESAADILNVTIAELKEFFESQETEE